MPGLRAGNLCIALAPAVVALAAAATPHASAIVVSPAPPGESWVKTQPSYIGSFGGSTAVAVGQRWIATVPHIGAPIGTTFTMNGVSFTTISKVQHTTADIVLYEVNTDLPGWHQLAPRVRPGMEVVLGGFGYTRGGAVTNGYAWSTPRTETWGANVVESLGVRVATRFDAPDDDRSVPGEASLAEYDSGGGLFEVSADGQSLLLAGIATAVSGNFTSSRWGDWSYFTNVEPVNGWITAIANPGTPVTSSFIATRIIPSASTPEPTAAAALLLVGGTLLGRRRRS